MRGFERICYGLIFEDIMEEIYFVGESSVCFGLMCNVVCKFCVCVFVFWYIGNFKWSFSGGSSFGGWVLKVYGIV